MTVSQLASFITTKLSDTDSSSVTVCKSFINQRAQMIWERYLWTESLGITSQSVAALTTEITLSTAPSVTFYQSAVAPTTFLDFPVAMRFTVTGQDSGFDLMGYDWMHFFQMDPNAWNNLAGRNTTPTNFINLPKDGSGYARIKPVPVPDVAGTLFVLGKLKYVTLGDNDTPSLRGIDNALLAYAEGDMLERGRQYSKAQAKYAEGAAHEQTMTDIETGQQQKITTITPLQEGSVCPVETD